MITTKPTHLEALLAMLRKKRRIVTDNILHPGTRPTGKSFNRREQMRRNRAKYGKRQISVHLNTVQFAIYRNWHMRHFETQMQNLESRPISKLGAYQSALYTSGYRLLEATPQTLIYQYEGRIH